MDKAQKALQKALPADPAPRQPVPAARCQVVEVGAAEAVVRVWMDGYELPRVGFPAVALRHHGLGVGGRFLWWMRGGQPSARDVDPGIPQGDGLTAAELAELQTLEERHAVGSGVGLPFTERTGDGR